MSDFEIILASVSIVLWTSLVVAAVLLWVKSILVRDHKMTYENGGGNSLESLVFVNIGGVQQAIQVRGKNADNPLLLVLHGGPGNTQIGWFDYVQKPWEEYFTVVQWDQRQAGKSYARKKDMGSTISNEQMIVDAEEVVRYLLRTYGKEKLFVLGKSYGSYLGMHLVKRHPEWVYAYVGDAQMINVVRFAEEEFKHLLRYARKNMESSVTLKLESMIPRIDPEAPWASFVRHEAYVQKQLDAIEKGMSPFSYGGTLNLYNSFTIKKLISSQYGIRDIYNLLFGDAHCISDERYDFSNEFMEIDIPNEIGSTFNVPIFLFTGANDWHVPVSYQSHWFDSIDAPHKEQVVFSDSRHYPYLEEPGKYLLTLVKRVLPFADPMPENNQSAWKEF